MLNSIYHCIGGNCATVPQYYQNTVNEAFYAWHKKATELPKMALPHHFQLNHPYNHPHSRQEAS